MTNTPMTYTLTPAQAELIADICAVPASMRADVLQQWRDKHGTKDTLTALCEALGMANAALANVRPAIAQALVEGGAVPHAADRFAENINLPTMLGAAQGAMMAHDVPQDTLCAGCALRLGTIANQSPSSTMDVQDIDLCDRQNGRGGFMCHMNGLDDTGEPTKPCPGWAAYQKKQGA